MKNILAIFMAASLVGCSSHTTTKQSTTVETPKLPSAPEPNRYQLPHTETFSLVSKTNGKTYNIVVSLPNSYNDKNVERLYPVLYVLDAQWQFPLFFTTAGAVNHDGDMPEALLVGVSWQEENGNLMQLRSEDLTPTAISDSPNSGGADKFQAFFRDELFPYIKSHYKASQNRTVTGGSTSSLFVYHTLLSAPDLFDGYIATSPTVYWDDGIIFRTLKDFPQDGLKSPKRAYLCWGSLEPGHQVQDFSKKLADKKLTNLAFKGVVVENAGHAGVNAECYNRGLQFVYAKDDIQLSDAVLKQYVGTYHTPEKDYSINFALVKHHLIMSYDDGTAFNLSAEKEDAFYARGNTWEYYFIKDGQNKIIGIDAKYHNAVTHFDPVKK